MHSFTALVAAVAVLSLALGTRAGNYGYTGCSNRNSGTTTEMVGKGVVLLIPVMNTKKVAILTVSHQKTPRQLAVLRKNHLPRIPPHLISLTIRRLSYIP